MGSLTDMMGEGGSLKTPGLSDGVGGSSNPELMAAARMSLSGNWGMGVLGYVLYFILVMSFSAFVFSSVFFVSVVSALGDGNTVAAVNLMQLVAQFAELLVSGAFLVGLMAFFLGIAQEGAARLDLLFVGFQRFWTSFAAYFFYSLFIFLWTLLFIVPGIIAAFSYAMVFFIIADDRDCGALKALGRSKEMMAGNKWKFFCLHWRFFGWALLAAFFTGGIGFLWLFPYMQTTFAKFYEDVK
ncbi:DUF975 family protein [Pontiella sulfatireligans]|nr:DUF975 family protein [Pontiella sulfatireligans]